MRRPLVLLTVATAALAWAPPPARFAAARRGAAAAPKAVDDLLYGDCSDDSSDGDDMWDVGGVKMEL